MLLWLEREGGNRAAFMNDNVAVFVRTIGHVICGDVGQRGEPADQVCFHPRDILLTERDVGLERVELGDQLGGNSLTLGLQGAKLLRQCLAPRLADLGLLDRQSLCRVDLQQGACHRCQPPPGQARVEGLRVFPDSFDVVHTRAYAEGR